jgi:hypothetical protein
MGASKIRCKARPFTKNIADLVRTKFDNCERPLFGFSAYANRDLSTLPHLG